MTDRELDALVAEKVMGWTREGNMWVVAAGPSGDGWCLKSSIVCPSFSTNIAAAWEVVEKSDQFSFQVERRHQFDDGHRSPNSDPAAIYGIAYRVTVLTPSTDYGYRCWSLRHLVWDTSAPRAICLAALKAVGVDAAAQPAQKQGD